MAIIILLLIKNPSLTRKDLDFSYGYNYHLYFTIPSFLLLLVPAKNNGGSSLPKKRNVLIPAVLLFVILSVFFISIYIAQVWSWSRTIIFTLPALFWYSIFYVFLGVIPVVSALLLIMKARIRQRSLHVPPKAETQR
ncbi:MAG: hypothetical protein FWD91_05470 [Treponema sp.]|nr:hypothetical protein [Treponema sp.]